MKRYTILFCIIFLFSFSSHSAHSERSLIMAVEIVRHGDRAPLKNFGSLAEKDWKTEELGTLTERGAKGSYNKGGHLKDYYVNTMHFISTTPSKDELYVASSETQRTIETAKNALKGMFAGYASNIKIDIIPDTADLLKTPSSREALSNRIFDNLSQDQKHEFQEIREYLNKKLNAELKTTKDVMNFGDLLVINRIHNKPFPESAITKDKANRIIELRERLYQHRAGILEFMCVASNPLLGHINDMFSKKISNDTPLKLVMFFAHDNNILSALSLFHKLPNRIPPYNADLRFELYKDKSDNYLVKLSLDDQVIDLCGSEYCAYNEFSKKVQEVSARCSAS